MVTVNDILNKKKNGKRISMLTAYDYPLASFIDEAGIDMVLVGDSLANVVLGLASTREVGMKEMLHHAKAVRRAVKHALVVGDMPFDSYQVDPLKAVANARLFMEEAGCAAVKLEWFDRCVEVASAIAHAGIPVIGHVGLTPQTAEQLGGFKVQGKEAASAKAILEQAKALEKAGCFAIVLECIPQELAALITKHLSIPTIGIGAGVNCDGQVLVIHDVLGLFNRYQPKFSKRYAQLGGLIVEAVKQYKAEVESGHFPDDAHAFHMPQGELDKLQ